MAERHTGVRFNHWATLLILVVIYDAFLITEVSASPEIVKLSSWLRFAVLTPAALAYILLDRHHKLGAWSGPIFSALVVTPTIISAIESRYLTSSLILYAFQVTPLLQLAVLTCRMGIAQAALTSAASCLTYTAAVLATSLVPRPMVPSLLLTDISIAIAVLVFTVRMDRRDRQVFLFHRQADIRGQALAEQNRKLAQLTQVDALTGLGNRRCFDNTLSAIWADQRNRQVSVSLIMFDIDSFKLFNDALGHQAGDDCLATLASVLAGCLRDERDTLARYGGEEFAVILPDTSLTEAWSVAERVRRSVLDRAIPHPALPQAGVVTISLGVAVVTPQESSFSALIEAADRCLYAAKRRGRNCTVAEVIAEHLFFENEAEPSTPVQAFGKTFPKVLVR